jgi:hypothetical protein
MKLIHIIIIWVSIVSLALLNYFADPSPNSEYDNFYAAYYLNLFFICLGFFYLALFKFKANRLLTYPNSYLVFPITRFDLFKKEFAHLAGNVHILALAFTVIFTVIHFYIGFGNSQEVIKVSIIFILQFIVFNWLFLLLKNIFHKNIYTNLLLIILTIQILNQIALTKKKSIFILNPIVGWLYTPQLFNYNGSYLIGFMLAASIIIFVICWLTKRIVKWHV